MAIYRPRGLFRQGLIFLAARNPDVLRQAGTGRKKSIQRPLRPLLTDVSAQISDCHGWQSALTHETPRSVVRKTTFWGDMSPFWGLHRFSDGKKTVKGLKNQHFSSKKHFTKSELKWYNVSIVFPGKNSGNWSRLNFSGDLIEYFVSCAASDPKLRQ